MTKSRILILLVATLLVFGMVACTPTATSDTPAAGNNTPPPSTGTVAPTEPPAVERDLIELIWINFDNSGQYPPPDQKVVEEYLNEMSVAALNTKMTMLFMDNDRCLLAMSAGDYFDITHTTGSYNTYAEQAPKGYFADITDLLPTVAPDLWDFIPQTVWQGTYVNNRIYAVPIYKDSAATIYVRFATDIFNDELGLNIVNDDPRYTTWESWTPLLEAALEARPDETPIVINRNGLSGWNWPVCSILGNQDIGVSYTKMDNVVHSTWEDEDALKQLQLMRDWYNAGYVNKGADTSQDAIKYSAIKTGQGFPGADVIWSVRDGFEQVTTPFSGPYYSTITIRGSMVAFSAASKYLERALEYYEFVNLDYDYRNALAYGIPGVNYEVVDGAAKSLTDGYIALQYSQATFFTPMLPQWPNPADMYERTLDQLRDAQSHPSLGFSYSPTKFDAEVAAIASIRDKYRFSLYCGSVDPTVEIPKMMAELEKVGYRELIADVQAELDAWEAAKK